jgi:hypothetical protein
LRSILRSRHPIELARRRAGRAARSGPSHRRLDTTGANHRGHKRTVTARRRRSRRTSTSTSRRNGVRPHSGIDYEAVIETISRSPASMLLLRVARIRTGSRSRRRSSVDS